MDRDPGAFRIKWPRQWDYKSASDARLSAQLRHSQCRGKDRLLSGLGIYTCLYYSYSTVVLIDIVMIYNGIQDSLLCNMHTSPGNDEPGIKSHMK